LAYHEVSVEEIPAEHPVRLFDTYWRSLSRVGGIPHRKEISPAGMTADVLRWLMILEVVEKEGENNFRYRLMGTGCVDLCGMDYTGRLLGDRLTPEGTSARRHEFSRVIMDCAPIYTWSELPVPDRTFLKVFRGIFPVTTNKGSVDQLFVLVARDNMQ
jgi:hypothetical protein